MASLASQTDVESLLGRSLTTAESARVTGVLAKLSAAFRREANRVDGWTAGTFTKRLKVNAERVYIPEPFTSVTSVEDDDEDPVEYVVRDQSVYVEGASSGTFLTVTYVTDGAVPDEVRLTVADAARKVLTIDEDALTGVSQFAHSEGPYSESGTYAAWAVGGEAMLGPDAKAVARAHRPAHPRVWVQQS